MKLKLQSRTEICYSFLILLFCGCKAANCNVEKISRFNQDAVEVIAGELQHPIPASLQDGIALLKNQECLDLPCNGCRRRSVEFGVRSVEWTGILIRFVGRPSVEDGSGVADYLKKGLLSNYANIRRQTVAALGDIVYRHKRYDLIDDILSASKDNEAEVRLECVQVFLKLAEKFPSKKAAEWLKIEQRLHELSMDGHPDVRFISSTLVLPPSDTLSFLLEDRELCFVSLGTFSGKQQVRAGIASLLTNEVDRRTIDQMRKALQRLRMFYPVIDKEAFEDPRTDAFVALQFAKALSRAGDEYGQLVLTELVGNIESEDTSSTMLDY